MVDSHESVHPTGLHQTYPNRLSSEAGRGREFNNAPTLGITPKHGHCSSFNRIAGDLNYSETVVYPNPRCHPLG